MSSLTIPFPVFSRLKVSLLLVEVTPFDVLIGVLTPSDTSLTYNSIAPSPFKSLEDLVENFFSLHNFEEQPKTAYVVLPLNFLDRKQISPLSHPPFSWMFDQKKFKDRFNFSEVFLCDRGTAIAKAIPFLGPADVQLFSNELSGYFSEPQNTCFLVNIDCGFEEVSLIPITKQSLKIWQPFKNLGGFLSLETSLSYIQHIIDVLRQEHTPSFPTISDFVEHSGIESLYRTLYQEKGVEIALKRKLSESPHVIDIGAPTDIDPLELSNPPRMSLEGMDISIASIEPRRIKKPKPASLTENPFSKKTEFNATEELDWTLIRSLTVFQILKGAFDFQSVKSSVFAQSSATQNLSLPSEIQKLCFETLDIWSMLLGTIIGRHTLLLNATGGAYISGRILYLLKDLFKDLSFVKSFEKESAKHPSFQQTHFFLISHSAPAFIGMVQLFLERDLE